jgi:hypothetical protein
MDIGQEVVNDLSDGDVVNVQFIALNKEQEQVERAFKLRQLYLVRGVIHRLVL